MIDIIMSPDGEAYMRKWQKLDGHWRPQNVKAIKTLEELKDWQAQQQLIFTKGGDNECVSA